MSLRNEPLPWSSLDLGRFPSRLVGPEGFTRDWGRGTHERGALLHGADGGIDGVKHRRIEALPHFCPRYTLLLVDGLAHLIGVQTLMARSIERRDDEEVGGPSL